MTTTPTPAMPEHTARDTFQTVRSGVDSLFWELERVQAVAEGYKQRAERAEVQIAALAQLVSRQAGVLALLRREHTVDPVTPERSCPASGQTGVPDIDTTVCTCGAAEMNQIIDLALTYTQEWRPA